jgi:hypothetical protein
VGHGAEACWILGEKNIRPALSTLLQYRGSQPGGLAVTDPGINTRLLAESIDDRPYQLFCPSGI